MANNEGISLGLAMGLIEGAVSPAAIESSVSDWLDDHPEATTTVADGAVSYAKLDSTLKGKVDAVATLSDEIDELDSRLDGYENVFTGNVDESVQNWLDDHPEATTTVQDHSLSYEKFINGTIGFVTPEMYGAKGDGVTDDATSIESAMRSGYPVLFARKTYNVSRPIIATAHAVYGNGATIKITSDFSNSNLFTFTDNINIHDISFDANGYNVNGFLMINAENSLNPVDAEIAGIKIGNVHDTNNQTLTSFINVYYCRNVHVHHVTITNCTKLSDDAIESGHGGLTGIRIQYFTGNLVAEQLHIENCYNVNSSGNVVIDDADGVFCLTISEKSHCVIKDSIFYNAGKRGVKIQSVNPAFVCGSYFYNDIPSLVNLITMQAQTINNVNIHGDGFVDDCVLINRSSANTSGSGIAISGDGKITNSIIDFANSNNNKGVLIGQNTTIVNCTLIGFVSGSNNTSKNLNIDTCRILVNGTGQGIQYYDTVNNGEVKITNTNFVNVSESILSECAYFASGTTVFIDGCTIGGYFTFYSNLVEIINSKIKLDNDSITYDRIFKLYGSGIFTICDISYIVIGTISQTSKTLIFIPSGNNVTLNIDNIDDSTVFGRIVNAGSGYALNIERGIKYERLNVSNFNVVNTIPDWVSSLPGTTSLKDGMMCLLSTDGKLYKIVNGSWAAV